jgi:D-sedoheptulose 7-phosphate isomerase
MIPDFVATYLKKFEAVIHAHNWEDVAHLADTLEECWRDKRQLFICGNGGSAANAIHLANDFLYGVDKPIGRGLRVTALPANSAVLTCLGNDIAYAEVFAQQLVALAQAGDVLIVLSGSGNSPNIIRALETGREMGMTTFAVLGFSGGRCLGLADHPIHFATDDMQISEDLQTLVGHMVMQRLCGKSAASK